MKKEQMIRPAFLLGCCLLTAALTAFGVAGICQRSQFRLLETLCGEMVRERPEAAQTLAAALKEYQTGRTRERTGPAGTGAEAGEGVDAALTLKSLGYGPSDFPYPLRGSELFLVGMGALAGAALLFFVSGRNQKRRLGRLGELTDWLERVNGQGTELLLSPVEDEFSGLQDEIYKTLTMLRQMSNQALEAKNRFADNLSNIAHQLKTPITSISLSLQTMKQAGGRSASEQIEKQLVRLTHLEEALLLLSRIDAGTLTFERRETDVFTLLMLAADNLEEVFREAGVRADIPELGEMAVTVDPEWTMEAFMNLLKNCMEHTPFGGTVHCFYEQNPLYTQITVWDEGEGFARGDLPHLFERFYRGRNAKAGGIGIGLAIAREILEAQDATVRARNLPEGGGCFEVRFYGR